MLASAVAATAEEIDLVLLRHRRKEHGSRELAAGSAMLKEKPEVVLLEDVVTTGASIGTAVMHLREAGMVCEHVIAIVDRLEGGRFHLQRNVDVDFVSLFTRDDFDAQDD